MGYMITVREAEITDSYDIALINIKDWENSLKGLVPDLFLANISVERRTGIWADILESAVSDTERVIFVSVHRGEINGYIHGLVTGESPVNLKIIDFAVSGNATQDTRRALFRQMMDFCARKKVHNMYALCTAQSDSADFYRMFSGKVSDVKEIDISGEKVPHTLFVWKSISDIIPVRKNIAKQILEITGIIGPVVCIILALLLGAALSHRELISMDFM
jgi:hypothetical protein